MTPSLTYRKHQCATHLRKCEAMRNAKERKRQAEASEWQDVGGFVTDGCLGEHKVRLLFSPDYSETELAITVDGEHRRPRTLRGVKTCMAKMVVMGHLKISKEASNEKVQIGET